MDVMFYYKLTFLAHIFKKRNKFSQFQEYNLMGIIIEWYAKYKCLTHTQLRGWQYE